MYHCSSVIITRSTKVVAESAKLSSAFDSTLKANAFLIKFWTLNAFALRRFSVFLRIFKAQARSDLKILNAALEL